MHHLVLDILCTHEIDNQSLGRLDYSLLPQQALMELFIANVDCEGAFEDEHENFLDIAEWEGVTVSPYDGTVIALFFEGIFQDGTLDFAAIPESAVTITIGMSPCTGTVPWEKLYGGVIYLSLYHCGFHGTVDLTVLPRGLIKLDLVGSNFSGTLNFCRLPKNPIYLNVAANALTGRVDLRPIAKTIDEITADHENLIVTRKIPPPDMPLGIDLSRNKLEGDILVTDISGITDSGQFRGLQSKSMVDEKGTTRLLLQEHV